ncbi:MAG: RHS repeat-associated core domain-containing protein [Ruminococcaceae bacterium]|nr:RHS repeat-associated core domain-containing protein [Oscillospiraceae bacterium]
MQTIDILSLKEYNYTYLDDKLVKSVEYDITVNESELVTSRAAVTTILYSYDKDDNMLKKRIIFADGGEETVYYDNSDEKNEVVKFYVPDSIDSVGEFLVTSHSKTDSFGRKAFDELQHSTGTLNRRFTYLEGEVTYEHRENDRFKSLPTTQLVKEIVISSARLTESDRILSYEYDGEERITKVTDSELGVTEYTYDALGQLLTETYTNLSGVSTVINTMTYDNYGNILTKNGKVYTYDSTWKDLLTSYDGQSITYDAQGNPTTYLGHTLTWEKGRQLKSYDGITYTYNSSGMRTSKTVDGVKHEYLYDGNKLIRETWGDNTLIPLYDNEDSVCGIKYNGESYFFVKNLQGDVISIIDIYGDTKVKYTYDAWGKCSIPFDSSNILIGDINPFRYRGYYYDDETNLYYLQSRYYNPEVGRFVNCDEVSYLEINELWLSYNLYAYCENEPINNGDHSGKWLLRVICSVAAGAVFGGVALAICNLLKLTKKQKKRISLAFSALGVLLGALLGVKVITKVAPKLIKWFKKIEKKIAFSFKGKECKVGVELFSSLKIMIHRPHTKSLHKYNPIGWHVQFEIKRSGRWIVAFRIKIDKVVKWYKSIK